MGMETGMKGIATRTRLLRPRNLPLMAAPNGGCNSPPLVHTKGTLIFLLLLQLEYLWTPSLIGMLKPYNYLNTEPMLLVLIPLVATSYILLLHGADINPT